MGIWWNKKVQLVEQNNIYGSAPSFEQVFSITMLYYLSRIFIIFVHQKAKEGENENADAEDEDPSDLPQDVDAMSHHSHATSQRTGVSRGSKASRARVMSRSQQHMDDVDETEEQPEEKRPTYVQSHSNKGCVHCMVMNNNDDGDGGGGGSGGGGGGDDDYGGGGGDDDDGDDDDNVVVIMLIIILIMMMMIVVVVIMIMI